MGHSRPQISLVEKAREKEVCVCVCKREADRETTKTEKEIIGIEKIKMIMGGESMNAGFLSFKDPEGDRNDQEKRHDAVVLANAVPQIHEKYVSTAPSRSHFSTQETPCPTTRIP